MSATTEWEDRYQVASYHKYPLEVVRGAGSWIETADGRRYLDFYGGHAVAVTGHCHSEVVAAIERQARELIFYSNLVYSPVRGRAVRALAAAAPAGLEHVFLVNSGTEANEVALQLARRVTERRAVVTFEGGFHGRTLSSLSACGIERYRTLARPELDDCRLATFGDLESVAARMDDAVAAVILEPIQSMAGVRTASPEFFTGLRELCDRHGSWVIYDEIQTGIGRTGQSFFAPRHGVTPDLLTVAKGIASGLPAGAVLMSGAAADRVRQGDLGSTFGGGPLVCAAIEATLRVALDPRTLQAVNTMSRRLREACPALPGIEAVSGEGFLLGLRVEGAAAPLQKRLLADGVLTGLSEDPAVLRLLPPLTLQHNELDEFLVRLEAAAEAVYSLQPLARGETI